MPERTLPTASYKGLAPASEAASRAKRANRKTNTAHEILLCRELWRLGLRYRKHVSTILGNPDLVFRRTRVMVFCDGDFWHARNWDKFKDQLDHRHNAAYWLAKNFRNREKDQQTTATLGEQGWLVLRFWETDIKKAPSDAAWAVYDAVISRTAEETSAEQT